MFHNPNGPAYTAHQINETRTALGFHLTLLSINAHVWNATLVSIEQTGCDWWLEKKLPSAK